MTLGTPIEGYLIIGKQEHLSNRTNSRHQCLLCIRVETLVGALRRDGGGGVWKQKKKFDFNFLHSQCFQLLCFIMSTTGNHSIIVWFTPVRRYKYNRWNVDSPPPYCGTLFAKIFIMFHYCWLKIHPISANSRSHKNDSFPTFWLGFTFATTGH